MADKKAAKNNTIKDAVIRAVEQNFRNTPINPYTVVSLTSPTLNCLHKNKSSKDKTSSDSIRCYSFKTVTLRNIFQHLKNSRAQNCSEKERDVRKNNNRDILI